MAQDFSWAADERDRYLMTVSTALVTCPTVDFVADQLSVIGRDLMGFADSGTAVRAAAEALVA